MALRSALRTAVAAARTAARSAKPSRPAAVGFGAAAAVTAGAVYYNQPMAMPQPTLIDTSSLTKVAKNDEGLLPQPLNPKYKTALVEIYVPSQPFGGSDKSNNGHRYDSIPFANGMIASGMSCQFIHYVPSEHDKCMEVLSKFDAIIVRCNPGQVNAAGGNQQKFEAGLNALDAQGIPVWPSPMVMENMGAKDALCKIADLPIGLPDTLAYYTPDEFSAGFKKTMAFQPRVIKQNRGSSGEGIWIIKLKNGDYCKSFGDRSATDDEVLCLMEANDNHAEEHTVAEFIEFCVNGRSGTSGDWTSKGVGKYLEGGKAAGGQLVDQRFCPRIVEGEVRVNMINNVPVGIIHKKPKEGGISAVGGTGSVYTFYETDAPEFAELMDYWLKDSLPTLMESLDLKGQPLPLWWTSDFIPVDNAKGGTDYIVGEFNCSCVGISACLPAYCNDKNPNASFYSMPAKNIMDATYLGNLIGQKALYLLDSAKNKPLSTQAQKVVTRVEALQGAAAAGVLSDSESKAWMEKLFGC